MVLMLLACGGIRTLNQFTLLALGCGLQGLVLAGRRPLSAGVWIGLALIKPHIGGPFLLWSVLTGAARTAAIAVGVVLGLVLVFCARVAESPFAVLTSYAGAVERVYVSVEHLTGTTELHPLVHLVLRAPRAELATLVIGLALLAVVCGVGVIARTRGRASLEIAALAALWSLLSFRHLSYNLVLMFPAIVALRFPEAGRSHGLVALRALPSARSVFVVTLAALVVDVPMLWRRALDGWLPAAVGPAFLHFDRVLVLGVFVYLVTKLRRTAK